MEARARAWWAPPGDATLRFVCPSCAASNSCPDAVAGLTIVCRKCFTQITVPEAPKEQPASWWLRYPYWTAVALVELLALGGSVALAVLLAVRHPPRDLPLLDPHEAGSTACLAAPGSTVTLAWQTDVQASGGYFRVAGQTVTLDRPGRPQLQGVKVRSNPWDPRVFRPDQPPPMKPIALSLQVPLPADEALAGERITLHLVVLLEYWGRSSPASPVTVQEGSVARDWSFAVATKEEQAIFARYLRRGTLARWGIAACAFVMFAVGIGAWLLARRHLNVRCPQCGRVTAATFYVGGRTARMSRCPHKGEPYRDG